MIFEHEFVHARPPLRRVAGVFFGMFFLVIFLCCLGAGVFLAGEMFIDKILPYMPSRTAATGITIVGAAVTLAVMAHVYAHHRD